MMQPQNPLAWLDGTQRFGVKLGLENTRRLLVAVGNPQDHLTFIHAAGTNGKGSVCAMMDSIFRAAGKKTGLYTSPHLVDLRELIRVDGELISHSEFDAILERLRAAVRDWDQTPTFFEIMTVAALMYFASERVDVVLLETGMGGRLDATNVVSPRVTVITPIGMDHQQWLGSTLAEIAAEKAGIIKPGVPVISSSQAPEAAAVIEATALRLNAALTVVAPIPDDVIVGLAGQHQRINAAVAIAAVQAAGFSLPDMAILQGLREVKWPGRFQKVENFRIDGAHNPAGIRALLATWEAEYPSVKPLVIFGALAEKAVEEMLASIGLVADAIWLVPIQNERAAQPEMLAKYVLGESRIWSSLGAALHAAGESHRPALITGSLYLVGEALDWFRIRPFGREEPGTTR
jgi:dihydrofolate synthase/folylpolyglutamate synthase